MSAAISTESSWVRKTADVCGGQACIRDSRHTVWGLVEWRRLGLSDREILDLFADLSRADLEAAWAYVRENAEEVARTIRENEEA